MKLEDIAATKVVVRQRLRMRLLAVITSIYAIVAGLVAGVLFIASYRWAALAVGASAVVVYVGGLVFYGWLESKLKCTVEDLMMEPL